MRRKDKEITSKETIEKIIRSSQICRLGLSDGSQPYIVPLSFGYDNETLFFHSAREGKKVAFIKKNPHVCFEFEHNTSLVESDTPCSWGMQYQSVIGFGEAEIVEDIDEKKEALGIIMQQYSTKKFEFPDAAIQKTFVFKVKINEMTGKQAKKL
ncbi:MAG: pyridoxamine 5'-phosphate oxidase [Deltaproteobacteria bacterium]|nr:MAG: pyridoxamine 5'-phosphate oxidase [Deltaproteobacteria bacterium]PIE73190.1 MAG: pyridoxamine 5'-phosphate oxidase [Deltaproteobacteria bacterium]